MADTTQEIYRAMDLSLRVGEILLSSGAGAADVKSMMLAVTSACGLRNCSHDINFTTLSVSYQQDPDSPPETHMRTIQRRGLDYGALSDVDRMLRRLVSGEIDRAEASAIVNDIMSSKRPYSRTVVTLATGMMAGGLSLLLGGNLLVFAVTVVTVCVIDITGRWLAARRIPAFYQQILGAVIATGTAVGLHELHIVDANPSLIVASGIIILLAGLSIVGAVQDALTGYYVTGSARTFETMLLTGGVIAGVSMTLTLAQNFGATLNIRIMEATLSDLPMQLLGAVIASVAFAVSCQVRIQALAGLALVGLFSQLLYQATVEALLPSVASGLAAFGVGLVAYHVGRQIKVPPLVVVTVGVVALLPGGAIYRGLYLLLVQTPPRFDGIIILLSAITIAVALAAGAILGEYVAQPLARTAGKLETRLSGPRLVGPLKQPSRGTTRKAARRLRKLRAREQASEEAADTRPTPS